MKAEITYDGFLMVTPESATEDFALNRWVASLNSSEAGPRSGFGVRPLGFTGVQVKGVSGVTRSDSMKAVLEFSEPSHCSLFVDLVETELKSLRVTAPSSY